MKQMQIYLASPCFSSADRLWNLALKLALDGYCQGTGLTFYLPQENVDEKWSSELIQHELVRGLIQSQAIVANLDGAGCDDGTCWEMGFVAGGNAVWDELNTTSKKNIFWYRTDFRRGGDSPLNVNLMMAHSAQKIELNGTSVQMVANAIQEALVQAFCIKGPSIMNWSAPPNCS